MNFRLKSDLAFNGSLGKFAGEFPPSTNGFSFLSLTALRRLFVMPAPFHFAECALALHFFLQRFESLIDVIVSNRYFQCSASFVSFLTVHFNDN